MHRIRLRHPWKASRLASPTSEWPRVVYSRNFNAPTGISDADVYLSVRLLQEDCRTSKVDLNGQTWAIDNAGAPTQINGQLQPFNRLTLEIECSPSSAEIPKLDEIAEVALLISDA